MSVARTLALTQDRPSHLLMFSKPHPTKIKTASLALGEIPSPNGFTSGLSVTRQ